MKEEEGLRGWNRWIERSARRRRTCLRFSPTRPASSKQTAPSPTSVPLDRLAASSVIKESVPSLSPPPPSRPQERQVPVVEVCLQTLGPPPLEAIYGRPPEKQNKKRVEASLKKERTPHLPSPIVALLFALGSSGDETRVGGGWGGVRRARLPLPEGAPQVKPPHNASTVARRLWEKKATRRLLVSRLMVK